MYPKVFVHVAKFAANTQLVDYMFPAMYSLYRVLNHSINTKSGYLFKGFSKLIEQGTAKDRKVM